MKRATWLKLTFLVVLGLAILIGTAVWFIDFAYIASDDYKNFIVPWTIIQMVCQTVLVRIGMRVVKADRKSWAAGRGAQ